MSTLLFGLLLLLLCQDESVDVKAHVERLGSSSYHERDEAADSLRALGRASLPALKQASKVSDPEVAARAKLILMDLSYLKRPIPNMPEDMVLKITKERVCVIQSRIYYDFKDTPQRGSGGKLEDLFVIRAYGGFRVGGGRVPPDWVKHMLFTHVHPDVRFEDVKSVWALALNTGKIPEAVLELPESPLFARLRFRPIETGENAKKLRVSLVIEEGKKRPALQSNTGKCLNRSRSIISHWLG